MRIQSLTFGKAEDFPRPLQGCQPADETIRPSIGEGATLRMSHLAVRAAYRKN